MSIEVSIHPTRSSRDELKKLVRELGFTPSGHLWDWPKGSLHFHWFDEVDYQSFDGVEATICPPSEDAKATLGNCTWDLHTRTRASASPADKEQQNNLIRLARARFGGSFYNDWFGRNRYTKVTPDARDAPTRGIYLAYEFVTDNIRAVRFALPEPQKSLERLVGTKLEPLSHADPARVLYNALVPFTVAALEHFFSRCFKILLHYEPEVQKRLQHQTTKVTMSDLLSVQSRTKTVEDIVADRYSFQSINSIHAAFSEWLDIDIWKILRRRRRIGTKLPHLESQILQLINTRHDVVHRFSMDLRFRKEGIQEVLDLVLAVIDTFVDHLENTRGKRIRD